MCTFDWRSSWYGLLPESCTCLTSTFRGRPVRRPSACRQVDALSDYRGPYVFDAEDVRLVLEYLEANERARLAEHEAYNRLCED